MRRFPRFLDDNEDLDCHLSELYTVDRLFAALVDGIPTEPSTSSTDILVDARNTLHLLRLLLPMLVAETETVISHSTLNSKHGLVR